MMIIDIVCPPFDGAPGLILFLATGYKFFVAHMWAVWALVGVIVGSGILFEEVRPISKWLVALIAVFSLAIVILSELVGACYEHSSLPGSLVLLLESEWAALAGMGVAAFFHWLLGPRVERLLDALTGKSHERRDRLSDIRSVDMEIPRRPKDFDPRKYFVRRQS